MNSKNKIFVLIVIITLILISFLSIKYFFNSKQDIKQTEVSVRMKWFFAGTMTNWFAGKDNGFFNEEGINLQINSGGPDNSSIKLVASGTDLFGIAGADEVLIAREKKIPIVPIAVLFKESPIGFISKKETGIVTPEQWSGKTIEVDYGSNAEIQFRSIIKKFNINNIKEIPYTFSLLPFIENKVDVSVAYLMDQVVTLKRQGIELNVITAKEYGINPYGDVIITSEKTLRENPELVQKFLKATIKSLQWSINNPNLAVNDLVKNVPVLKKENELAVWQATIPFILSNDGESKIGEMSLDRWNNTQQILLEFNGLKNKQDLESFVTLRLNN